MIVFEDEAGARLELPDEPTGLRDGLRDALLEGQEWPGGVADELCIGRWLWARWGTVLEAEGMGQKRFDDELLADRRELWLWLMGDRQWSQFVEGLAGRILRRLPTTGAEGGTLAR